MKTLRCPNCGRINKPGNRNCVVCGYELYVRDHFDTNLPPRLKYISIMNCILLVIIMLLVLYIMNKSQLLSFSLW
jgi:hypothetical protein